MGKRQEAALETRQKLIDAMRSLLNEKSADCIGIEEITEKAGVAKGTFYTYFKRKEDIISVIAMDCYNSIKEAVLLSDDAVYDMLCAYLRSSASIIERYTLQIAQNWIKSVAAPLKGEQGGIIKYVFDRDNIEKMLESGIKSKQLQESTPVKVLAQSIMNSYYGGVLSWCMTNGDVVLSKSIDNYCDNELKLLIEHYTINNQ